MQKGRPSLKTYWNRHKQENPTSRGDRVKVSYLRKNLRLVTKLVWNRQTLTTFSTATCQNFATVLGAHALTESVLVLTLSIAWLKCTFHDYLVYLSVKWTAKIHFLFASTSPTYVFIGFIVIRLMPCKYLLPFRPVARAYRSRQVLPCLGLRCDQPCVSWIICVQSPDSFDLP